MAEHFPRDAWYAVGGAAMLAEGEVMSVKLFGEERVAWRGDDGESHVWHNRCIHRGMRLQFGFVDGDRLACRFGRRFGGDAQCKEFQPLWPRRTIFVFRSFSRPKRTASFGRRREPRALTSPAFPAAKISFSVALLPFTRRRMPSLSISETWMYRLQRREFYRRS